MPATSGEPAPTSLEAAGLTKDGDQAAVASR